jgi:cellulose synthase/poly-beta-1,6-N-acetylglucosamine synthase-like glycosyltransferase
LLAGHGLFTLVLLCWFTATTGAFLAENLVAWSAGLLYIAYDTWLLGYVAWQTRGLRPPGSPERAAVDADSLSIGVLVPARNEQSVLAPSLAAALAQCGPRDQVWIVDDGSMDGTAELLARDFGLPPGPPGITRSTRHTALHLLRKLHSGKADSLNRAWPGVDADVVVTLDADTVLEAGALTALRAAFAQDPQLAAACGILRPQCRRALWGTVFEWFQTYEYLRTFLSRAAWMRANALLLVSGAFAAYRKSALEAIGGYDANSLVEDYELIHRLHRHSLEHGKNWNVGVVGSARAVTDAPATLSAFLKQRRRWFAGFLETQFANADMAGNARYGALGRLMLPVKAVDTLQPIFGLTAFALLVFFLLTRSPLAPAVLAVIVIKLAIDFSYHLWALDRYHRWLGLRPTPGMWARSIAATFAEPFSFQLMRHAGAALGWWSFLSGRVDWAPQRALERPA